MNKKFEFTFPMAILYVFVVIAVALWYDYNYNQDNYKELSIKTEHVKFAYPEIFRDQWQWKLEYKRQERIIEYTKYF